MEATDTVALDDLPHELAEEEARGLRLERHRHALEEKEQAHRKAKEFGSALDNWGMLRASIGNIPACLAPYLPHQLPDEFTGDCRQWYLEIPLPCGRPPLVAFYEREENGPWLRKPLRGDNGWWRVMVFYLDEEMDEIALDAQSSIICADLPTALVAARAQAVSRRKLEEQQRHLQGVTRTCETAFSPPPACAPQCSQAERVLLDALREYLWDNTPPYELTAEEPHA